MAASLDTLMECARIMGECAAMEIQREHVPEAVHYTRNAARYALRAMAMLDCAFCGATLTASDTYCCPHCGWKVGSK